MNTLVKTRIIRLRYLQRPYALDTVINRPDSKCHCWFSSPKKKKYGWGVQITFSKDVSKVTYMIHIHYFNLKSQINLKRPANTEMRA